MNAMNNASFKKNIYSDVITKMVFLILSYFEKLLV